MSRSVTHSVLGTILFTILVPSTVAGLAPYFLIVSRSQFFTFTSSALWGFGLVLFLAGVTIYAWCAFDFATAGRGTPSPTHPPQELVVRGLYRYSRNPMYVGVVSVAFGEALFFGSGNALAYALFLLLAFHPRVIMAEEKTLRHMFGGSYEAYCARVPRWVGIVKKEVRDGN